MPARFKRVYFDYYRGVELILKLECTYKGATYIPFKDQADIDRRLEMFSDIKFCERISEKACGVNEITHDPTTIERYKRQRKELPKFAAKYPKAVWDFGRKLRYAGKDAIYIHTRTFWQFRQYIREPDYSPSATAILRPNKPLEKQHVPKQYLLQSSAVSYIRGLRQYNWTGTMIIARDGTGSVLIRFTKKGSTSSQLEKKWKIELSCEYFIMDLGPDIPHKVFTILNLKQSSNKTFTGYWFHKDLFRVSD